MSTGTVPYTFSTYATSSSMTIPSGITVTLSGAILKIPGPKCYSKKHKGHVVILAQKEVKDGEDIQDALLIGGIVFRAYCLSCNEWIELVDIKEGQEVKPEYVGKIPLEEEM